MKWIKRLILGLLLLAVVATAVGAWFFYRAGLDPEDFANYAGADVEFDHYGIPTIEAPSWEKVLEAQGYVVASQRFYHLDMLRRYAGGRLSEVVGDRALKWDTQQRTEGWRVAAEQSYELLPPEEKAVLQAYARGVNAFLNEHPDKVGVEYDIMGFEPEPFEPKDSLLIVLLMCKELSSAAEAESVKARWKEKLSSEWFEFLFTQDHPWNDPIFGVAPRAGPVFPKDALPSAKPVLSSLGPEQKERGASNNWVYCKGRDCFVANDPHLGATVPHLWFANRLRVSAKEWTVGVSIPGIPGIVLGMNPYMAWAFTNVGEDVDDYLQEKLTDDKKQYLAEMKDGQPVYRDIMERTEVIKIKGAAPKEIVVRYTHRGPLVQPKYLKGLHSRQWLPLKPGMLRAPSDFGRSKSIEELHQAVDTMKAPAQNVVAADRQGRIAYRASGTTVDRPASGRLPRTATTAEWRGFLPASSRRRLIKPAVSATTTQWFATANERIWVDEFGHNWTADQRKDRLRTLLSSDKPLNHEDMVRLQLDTTSRYLQLVLRFVADNATNLAEPTRAAWRQWDGSHEGGPLTFTQALAAEEALMSACVQRVRDHFELPAASDLPFWARQRTGWMIAMLQTKDNGRSFGFKPADLADLVAKKALEDRPLHAESNRWGAQHGLANALPVVGALFAVDTPPQVGASGVPRVERPTFGASCRLIWNLGDPLQSTWSLPVGQSGHARSRHYADLQQDFHAGRPLKVFGDKKEWWFAPREP